MGIHGKLFVWTDNATREVMMGTEPPDPLVPFAEAPEGARPSTHYFCAETRLAKPLPPRPDTREPMEFDAVAVAWVSALKTPVAKADFVAKETRRPLDEVNAERTRRITEGTDITVPDYGPIPVQGRAEDMTNLTGLYNVATERRLFGDTSASMTFRDRLNALHALTPQQMINLYVGAIAWVEAVYRASWALKEGEVPEDITNDRHWPA